MRDLPKDDEVQEAATRAISALALGARYRRVPPGETLTVPVGAD